MSRPAQAVRESGLGVLRVGGTELRYSVRVSPRARRKRIVVTPNAIEVVVPQDTPVGGRGGVDAYVDRKRRWIFDAVREVDAKHRQLLAQTWASGAKLQYRGRWLMLDIHTDDVDAVEIRCRSRFHVLAPADLSGDERVDEIRTAFDTWLKGRAAADLRRFSKKHAEALRVRASGVRLADQRRSWGTCGKDGVIRVHWRLIQAPAAAMEYVVAHELVHLLHRNHSPGFWAALARTMPDWPERKAMLERWETEHRAV